MAEEAHAEEQIVVADIGGTNARFAIASLGGDGAIRLGEMISLPIAEHPDIASAWRTFADRSGRALPAAAALSVAAPIEGDRVVMTNGPWCFSQASLPATLGVDRLTILNDFGAVAHAVERLGDEWLLPVCGPGGSLPRQGVISIIGPGTGLGIAMILRSPLGTQIVETEGSHNDFAPVDAIDDAILTRLRKRHSRVSVERVVSGPGLADIHAAIAPESSAVDERCLWRAALESAEPAAIAALARFCAILGSVAGDVALVQAARGVVIAGGIGLRLADRLATTDFAARFVAKGRYEGRMRSIPVRLITHPQPGLYGAAAAYLAQYR